MISLCESLIFWLVVLFIPRLLQYLLRISHFPPSYCIFHSLLGSIFMVHFLLMVDTLVVVKYLLIFVVQDPLGINDQMWSIVVNVAIAAFSVTSQLWFTYFQNGTNGNYVESVTTIRSFLECLNMQWRGPESVQVPS